MSEPWTTRAPAMLLQPGVCPREEPDATTMDRRWLWRLESFLSVSGTRPIHQQMASDLRQYLNETCEHHWHDWDAEVGIPAHRQCLYCHDVEWVAA